MMMKRKMNRVKKEYQVYMHKVHVLCWLGHGNYVSRVLNDQEVMAAALAMVPKGCYPEDRVTTKYVEQITTWFKDKLTLKQDKHENKFRPKAPPLKNTILSQIKSRVTTAKKFNIFIFIAMLRALGLQCRVMFNFVTVPIRPPSSELCSLSIKPTDDGNKAADKSTENTSDKSAEKTKPKTAAKSKAKCTKKIAQVDGIDDAVSESDSEFKIMQLDGSNDTQLKTRCTRSTRAKKVQTHAEDDEDDGVSPTKKAKTESSNVEDVTDNGKIIEKITKETNTSKDRLPEAPKSPLRNRPVRKKTATKNDATTKDRDKIREIMEENKEKIKVPPNFPLRKTAKNKNATNNTNETTENSKSPAKDVKSTKRTDKLQEVPPLPFNRSARNKDVTPENASASVKRETSKSPQTRTNNAKNNKALNDISALKTSASPSKTADDTVKDVEISSRKTRSDTRTSAKIDKTEPKVNATKSKPTITITDENQKNVESKFFSENKEPTKRINISRKRSHTTVNVAQKTNDEGNMKLKTRTKSAPGSSVEKSKYFDSDESVAKKPKINTQNTRQTKKEQIQENKLRVSHRDLRQKAKPKNDVTEDLIDIIKSRIKVEKVESKKGIVKGWFLKYLTIVLKETRY